MKNSALQQKLSDIPLIGEKKAKLLQKLGLETVAVFFTFLPRAYEDRSAVLPLTAFAHGDSGCFCAHVMSRDRRMTAGGRMLVKIAVSDGGRRASVVFFNMAWIYDKLIPGTEYIFFGRAEQSSSELTFINPDFEQPDSPARLTRRILPVYPLTAGLSRQSVLSLSENIFALAGNCLEETLPGSIRAEFGLVSYSDAISNIHFPESFTALTEARRRLMFEELLVTALAVRQTKAAAADSGFAIREPKLEELYAALPFSLTGDQQKAIDDCLSDLAAGRVMSRLIQGDVGSGKTAVAAAMCYAVAKAGCQAAFMCPTEVLALQQAETLARLFAPLGITVTLLTGKMTAAAKKAAAKAIGSGLAQIVVGTHALFSESVAFSSLALVVTDEQHRFGVRQRAAMLEKAETPPHMLVMSATPIPRTLALLLYGDLSVSVIREMPKGRVPIKTYLVNDDYHPRLLRFIEKTAAGGGQTYVIVPSVEESEALPELKSAVSYHKQLQEELPGLTVGLLHGKLKPKDKEREMEDFASGKTQVLVATTVVEVGVDVPNATLMIIENAERFGLSQLHQLRGRVGRGASQSYCVLVRGSTDTGEPSLLSGADRQSVADERLRAVVQTTDGFELAEKDLLLRGAGEFFGERQSGFGGGGILAKIGATDAAIVDAALSCATALAASPELQSGREYSRLREKVGLLLEAAENTFN
ncbi:MAG: ATP-dependent DNA helicase RecG [Oscillospiraceae bacterium]|nr:ATP-dependent DNA helicase RecG [Oscillospiraceae bacterium]